MNLSIKRINHFDHIGVFSEIQGRFKMGENFIQYIQQTKGLKKHMTALKGAK